MEDQFLNLKKCKNKALAEADQQTDSFLDPRTFYAVNIDDEEHLELAFTLRQQRRENERPQTSQAAKKKKYV
ncbi:unnamed protein product [Sphagnum balticum]